MTSVIEAIKDAIGTLVDDEPKPPLHVGEVMNMWTMLTIFQEGHALYLVGLNMTVDPELIHALQSAVEGSRVDIDNLREFMIREGVPLPAASEPKPKSDPAAVPVGARLTDDEIANLIAGKIAACITLCGATIAQSLRTDVGSMFLKIEFQLLKYGISLKTLMRKRGWLKEPPSYVPPGLPNA